MAVTGRDLGAEVADTAAGVVGIRVLSGRALLGSDYGLPGTPRPALGSGHGPGGQQVSCEACVETPVFFRLPLGRRAA